jgi:hypothetical protein
MQTVEQNKPCPLCGTMLPYDKWLKVVGVYEEQQKHRKQLEQELLKTRENGQKLREEYKKIKEKEKQLKSQYLQKIKEERKKIKETQDELKNKERLLKAGLEEKYKLRHEKLCSKFEKEKQRAVNRTRREGIKIGSEKEKSKAEKLKNAIESLKKKQVDNEAKLKLKFQRDQEKIKRKLEREKQIGLKQIHQEGIKAGIEKQKARTEKVSQMAEKYRKARDEAIERAKQLEEMIKKGTTPQMEGLDFEHELANQLKQKFPEDEIKPTGKKGDIIQTVQAESKKVGKIIYECKKTKEFQNKFIEQIRRDKTRAIADYGVIVTWATKEDRQGFWVEGDIIIVHPYGVLDIAIFLRETLLQVYTLKLSKSEFETKGKAILELMQSEEFRSRIQDSIAKSREAYEILKKEYKTHMNTWKKRLKIYESIHRNTSVIQNTVRYVLLHGKIPEKLPEAKELPALPISAEKAEKVEGNSKA